MPAFRYEAVDAQGQVTKGVLNADSSRAARSDLRAKGLTPVLVEQIQQTVRSAKSGLSFFSEKLSGIFLVIF